ncbi:six-bladed beta-propeller -like protein [Ophiostoma piceae UAMH 11346]|uniref:Six-bladed beta-propeller-like protein n=1 Tax=Ophiostoma piceae (strain UAMH 11346) TaxID=1262450 RepID=S3CMS9_OPHP1|nr:six-bladed beta-propeller -like protein [Ophiostoma piceae UAMH 11346]
MHLINTFLTAVLAVSVVGSPHQPASPPTANVSVLATFPKPVWNENLAIRGNGYILTTRFDKPEVYQVNPGTGERLLVRAFDASVYSGCLGIAEGDTDIFYVISAPPYDDQLTKINGTNTIFRIDMATFETDGQTIVNNATVTKVIDIDAANILNGMTAYDDNYILVADSVQGIVYEVDLAEGRYVAAVEDPKMKATYNTASPATPLGVNGIKMFRSYLYWTNTAGGFVARVPFNSLEGALGNSSIAITDVPLADDFIIRDDAVAFVCQNQVNTLSVAYLDFRPGSGEPSVKASVIAGSLTSTMLAGVSAAEFSRTEGQAYRLYLTTSGAEGKPINGTTTVGSTVSYIDTSVY